MRGFETFAGDIFLEIGIITTVLNSVIFPFAIKLDKEFKIVEFLGKLM